MDNFNHDNVDVVGSAQQLFSTAKNIAKGLSDKKKTKEAKQIAESGQYWTMRAYLKNLIPIPEYIVDQVKDQGISEYAVIQLPAQSTGGTTANIIAKLQALSVAPMPSNTQADIAELRDKWIVSLNPSPQAVAATQAASQNISTGEKAVTGFKKYLPWIFLAILLGGVAWAITHQAK